MLYHGVNKTMLLDPCESQSFYGPLSTSSSKAVAKKFATSDGMVLEICSQYPRLEMCTAFDASTISVYPEEQEWLIGFIYLRVRKVYTRISENICMETKLKYIFFAIHLFVEGFFSMNASLENLIIPFIQIHLFNTQTINM